MIVCLFHSKKKKFFSEYSFPLITTGIIPIPSQSIIPNSGFEPRSLEQEVGQEKTVELESAPSQQRQFIPSTVPTQGSNGKRKDITEISDNNNKRKKITPDSNSASPLPSLNDLI